MSADECWVEAIDVSSSVCDFEIETRELDFLRQIFDLTKLIVVWFGSEIST